ncbi:ceramide synthase 2 isoform X1 [Cygnus olor]|uniref:ceramide synthase 2 isoform X1 n=1 Tax=Cygnus olor TaxID=8869 RepID=UPI001ADEAA91|nr:ceramide synthase 2 isoform X1 [Cygnus olor]
MRSLTLQEPGQGSMLEPGARFLPPACARLRPAARRQEPASVNDHPLTSLAHGAKSLCWSRAPGHPGVQGDPRCPMDPSPGWLHGDLWLLGAEVKAGMFQTLYSYFWWERLWLPANLTWADLEDRDGRVYAKASDLYITIPLAFLFLIVRHLFETYVATPLAGLLNVKEKIRLKATPNAVLEKFYAATTKHPKQADVEMLSKKSGCTVRQVERWFRRRRNQDRPSLLKKFREASWRFTFYLIAFIAGMAVIVDKPWFYDLREVWKGYPIQSMLPSQYWYYMIELSFYWSLLFSIASDVKRKDFKEQIIHHVATIILISFSWFANYIRAGTLIMALHDSSDYLLESAKMFNYAGWRNTCNNIFIVFAAVFIVTRLVILPFWIMHCTVVYPLDLYPAFFGYYFFNFMMAVLQSLHIFWAYLIIRMAQKFITGKVVEDERSDREETDNSEEEEEVVKNGPLSNGHPVLNNNHRKND